ncbi:MAG: ATP-dependent DNA helicase DinG [Candidatus Binatia bacterium]|nr:MAG: ATP-dependent DNA helicase DinG [Candidatus Binatia bacterium]
MKSGPQPATQRLGEGARTALLEALAEAGRKGILALGIPDRRGRVEELRFLAAGTVPPERFFRWVRSGEVFLRVRPGSDLRPEPAEEDVARRLSEVGSGFWLLDEAVSRLLVLAEARLPAAATLPAEEILATLDRLRSVLPSYEERPEQSRMAEAVARALSDEEVLVVEAGTGTGKSLAYLVPLLLWSRKTGERVAVATRTIPLQEQLEKRELPLLVRGAALDLRTALVKGRNHYVCRRKVAELEAEPGLFPGEDEAELHVVLDWARSTSDGSLSDLGFVPSPDVWQQVVSENDNCLRTRCPFYSNCFFYEARRAALGADLLVTNQHLLLADAVLREQLGPGAQNAVLPPFRRLVVDEAHRLEEVATSLFGGSAGLSSVERLLARLRSPKKTDRGFLPALSRALRSAGESGRAERIVGELSVRQTELLDEARAFFRHLAALLPPAGDGEETVTARPERLGSGQELEELASRARELATGLLGLGQRLEAVARRLAEPEYERHRTLLFLRPEASSLSSRFVALADFLGAFFEPSPEKCRWVERRQASGAVTLQEAPVRVAPLLRRLLFERYPTVVLASATLATAGDFSPYFREIGLDGLSVPERVVSLLLPSPFDYASQSLLAVPADMPEPTDPDFPTQLHEAIFEIALLAGGGVLLLFTSHASLEAAWQALDERLRSSGLEPLRQGTATRTRLLERFRRGGSCVLFGTDTFWEGVDVPGDALRCVVLSRLPFPVPTEPVLEARSEALRAEGRDPFSELALPLAVRKLKQGFGRLVRTRTDRGAVVVLDSRLARRRYGEVFLASLPPARKVVGSRNEVFLALSEFFSRP